MKEKKFGMPLLRKTFLCEIVPAYLKGKITGCIASNSRLEILFEKDGVKYWLKLEELNDGKQESGFAD